MSITFKKITSVFFLLLFIFPMVEKEYHALEHSDDFHCTSVDKHFHEQEHSCAVCDYTLPYIVDLNIPQIRFIIAFRQIQFFPFLEKSNVVDVFYNKPARAPPVS